jgi:hypothetical protein
MRSPVVWLLVALTVVAVAVGIWFFVRDEYPFNLGPDDVVALTYESHGENGPLFGYVEDPPADLAGWVSLMERDTSGEAVPVEATVTIMVADGRRLRLEVSGGRATARWVGIDGRPGTPVTVHLDDRLVWYLKGLRVGLESASPPVQRRVEPSPVP